MRALLTLLSIALIAGAGALLMRAQRGAPAEQGPAGEAPAAAVVAEGLDVPWGIAFLPEGGMLVTERPGRVVLIEDGEVSLVHEAEEVVEGGEGGLLGIALHPDFSAQNRFVYLYLTVSVGRKPVNNVVRYTYSHGALAFDRVIVDGIPASRNHDGGRIAFGPDGMLYVATGDAGNAALAQDPASLAGKILRVRDDGEPAEDNPFGTAVYSLGHRNPQGLAWDDGGRMWSTEHGRSGLQSGYDEINAIVSGKNYGWPDSQGDEAAPGTQALALHSGADETWAPASAAYLEGRLFFGGLRGEALYEATLSEGRVLGLREHFKGAFGRIRTVAAGPDGMLYLTTSNRDGRGGFSESDDKILRVNPSAL